MAVPRVFDDDARQHVYWTYRFRDGELFRDDLLTAFMSSPKVAPLGYQALYFLGVQVFNPLLFSQLLSLALALLATWLIFCLGCEIGGRQGGSLAAGGFLLYYLYATGGGLPKSFAFPLLLASLLSLERRRYTGVAALFVLQSLFYPPVLLNTAALVALRWGRQRRLWRQAWRQLALCGLGLGLAGGLLLGVYASHPAAFGRQITAAEARAMPEFSAQGRSAFYGDTLLQTLANERGGIGASRLLGFAGLLLLLALLQRPPRLRVPAVVGELLLTSGVLFLLAHALLFRLHLPSRYVLYTFPLAALLLIAANTPAALAGMRQRWPGLLARLASRPPRWNIGWALVALLAFAYVQNRYLVHLDPLVVYVDRQAMPLYRYLHTLPKDVLIAGHPLDLDNVPLLAQRTVLVNRETSLPYFTGYYGQVRQRLFDTLAAYYAAEEAEVWRFVKKYGIDYLLLNRERFTPQFVRNGVYYEPFASFVRQRLTEPPRFALLALAKTHTVYAVGPYRLLSFHRKGTPP
ncbi:MAG: hypothetical protein KatS3mg131_3184 [Candidatus Tectimicrobiota bacterium]|nr:MAG: hypothetical protein KatS3mg131_3184 [Candidatus Tectomicrobia bacterium]